MGEFDFLTPIPKTTVQVKLPSRGVLYPKGSPASGGKLTLTPMTMVEEAVFANPRSQGGEAVDTILKRCIQESVDVNTLLSSDKFFMFMILRAITYGPKYSFVWTCTARKNPREACGRKNEKTVRIPDDFEVKYLADEDKEPFILRLKDSGKEVSLRLLRGYDEPMIDKYTAELEAKRKQGIQIADTTQAYRLSRHLVAVDGKSVEKAPEDKVLSFLVSLSSKDIQQIRDTIVYYTPGISTGVTLVCADCGTVHEWDLPFTADFFRAVDTEPGRTVVDEVRPDVPPRDEVQRDNEPGPSGTPVVLREAARDEGTGDRNREGQTRSAGLRRISRGHQETGAEPTKR